MYVFECVCLCIHVAWMAYLLKEVVQLLRGLQDMGRKERKREREREREKERKREREKERKTTNEEGTSLLEHKNQKTIKG